MPTAEKPPPEKMMFQLNLRRRGISDQAVLRAMEAIPRDAFVEPADRRHAYDDTALGIACGQTISQPFVVAYMTEQLQLRGRAPRARDRHRLRLPGGDPVEVCRQVVTIERFAPWPTPPASGSSGCTATMSRCCSGTASTPGGRRPVRPHHRHRGDGEIPEALTGRLEPGGILIAPVGPHNGTQTLVRLLRDGCRRGAQGAGRRTLRAGAARDRAGVVSGPPRFPPHTLLILRSEAQQFGLFSKAGLLRGSIVEALAQARSSP